MWSSHSPTRLPPPRSRASWPSAASRAYPITSNRLTATPVHQVIGRDASTMIPARLKPALTSVTWFGFSPHRYAIAANRRPNGRLTYSE